MNAIGTSLFVLRNSIYLCGALGIHPLPPQGLTEQALAGQHLWLWYAGSIQALYASWIRALDAGSIQALDLAHRAGSEHRGMNHRTLRHPGRPMMEQENFRAGR
jgi:hypothetical protein